MKDVFSELVKWALDIAMQELQVNQGTIVTLDEEEEIVLEQGTISVMPLIKFFLK